MDPKNLRIRDFSYELPEHRIAKFPLAERDSSRLLIYQRGRITEDSYRHIASHLTANSLIVFNNTKVVEARILFKKLIGATIEIFCLEPDNQYHDIASAMMQKGSVWWDCLIGGASKWKKGLVLQKTIPFNDGNIELNAKYIQKKDQSFVIEFSWTPPDLTFLELLHHAGLIPLPPYIKREVQNSDAERYQTIYARRDGSVAAPTAGLHFTPEIFQSLQEKKIKPEYVTLHVGAGTFQPVKKETMAQHDMHGEYIEVSHSAIQNLLLHLDNSIISVGTTSLRVLESLYWMGCKIKQNPEIEEHQLEVHQWDPYDINAGTIDARSSLLALLKWMDKNKMQQFFSRTQLLIAPGYKFNIVNTLVTNFHQPQSTLLLLVAAFIGEDWKKVYGYALDNDFRFLSYGDGCLLFRS
ncbi:MAG: S-adenosylmethionine tRNA ribosyltransferase [Bacteroidetes bacterium]|nr:MAG: S-adenosylmethionine tRNA ribosyltransferase [Bacteroidota bacterium]